MLVALYYTHDVISFQNFQLASSFKACSHIKSLFGQQKMVTQFPSLITNHSNFHIRLPSSSNFYHSIFFTLFIDPTTVTVSDHLCFVTRVPFSSPSVFLFFSFPLPLQPCLSPKAETQTQKNVSTSLASSVPSSPVYIVQSENNS